MKIPAHEYEDTVHFFRKILRFKELTGNGANDTPRFEFGDKVLWLDRMPGFSQSEIWLEVVASDIDEANALAVSSLPRPSERKWQIWGFSS